MGISFGFVKYLRIVPFTIEWFLNLNWIEFNLPDMVFIGLDNFLTFFLGYSLRLLIMGAVETLLENWGFYESNMKITTGAVSKEKIDFYTNYIKKHTDPDPHQGWVRNKLYSNNRPLAPENIGIEGVSCVPSSKDIADIKGKYEKKVEMLTNRKTWLNTVYNGWNPEKVSIAEKLSLLRDMRSRFKSAENNYNDTRAQHDNILVTSPHVNILNKSLLTLKRAEIRLNKAFKYLSQEIDNLWDGTLLYIVDLFLIIKIYISINLIRDRQVGDKSIKILEFYH